MSVHELHADGDERDATADGGGMAPDASVLSDQKPQSELTGLLDCGAFLDCEELLQLLAYENNGLTAIPNGIKENVYFILKTRTNEGRRLAHRRS